MGRKTEVAIYPAYRTDAINAAMGALRLTNRAVAEKAGVGVMTVSKIRNGNPSVGYVSLKKVVEALGLSMAEVSEPKSRSVERRFLIATLELVVRLTT